MCLHLYVTSPLANQNSFCSELLLFCTKYVYFVLFINCYSLSGSEMRLIYFCITAILSLPTLVDEHLTTLNIEEKSPICMTNDNFKKLFYSIVLTFDFSVINHI